MEDVSLKSNDVKNPVFTVPVEDANSAAPAPPKREMWAFIICIVLAIYNGVVGISAFIRMLILHCSPIQVSSNNVLGIDLSKISVSVLGYAFVGHSVIITLQMMIIAAIYGIIAFGPLNYMRKLMIYTCTVVAATLSIILWIMLLVSPKLELFAEVTNTIYVPLFYALMAFYDDSELAKMVLPYPKTD